MKEVFSFLGQPENFKLAVAFATLYTIFMIIVGFIVGWMYVVWQEKKIEKKIIEQDYSYDAWMQRQKMKKAK